MNKLICTIVFTVSSQDETFPGNICSPRGIHIVKYIFVSKCNTNVSLKNSKESPDTSISCRITSISSTVSQWARIIHASVTPTITSHNFVAKR